LIINRSTAILKTSANADEEGASFAPSLLLEIDMTIDLQEVKRMPTTENSKGFKFLAG
jgi:hypothetical protein